MNALRQFGHDVSEQYRLLREFLGRLDTNSIPPALPPLPAISPTSAYQFCKSQGLLPAVGPIIDEVIECHAVLIVAYEGALAQIQEKEKAQEKFIIVELAQTASALYVAATAHRRALEKLMRYLNIAEAESPPVGRRDIEFWLEKLAEYESAKEDAPELTKAAFARSIRQEPNTVRTMFRKAQEELARRERERKTLRR